MMYRLSPVAAAASIVNPTRVAVGTSHACALAADGLVRCWGRNLYGALGDGTAVDRTAPVAVALPPGAVSIAVGESHSCASMRDNTVFCWGRAYDGQLGDGGMTDRSSPIRTMF